MVFKIHSMKKEKIMQRTKDQIFWEDYVEKNNIKKKFQLKEELIQSIQVTRILLQRTILFLIHIRS